MNDARDPRPRATTLAARRAVSLLALAGLVAGCNSEFNPFMTADSDLGTLPPITKTRLVDRLAPEQFATPPEAAKPPEKLGGPRSDPFAGIERMEVSLEQARAWTLEHNLDLRVALIDPAIANEALNEEEGRFESVFFTRAQYNKLNQPTSSELAGSEVETGDIDAGVRIPLRTGGTAVVSVPMNRTETNNSFATLNPSYTADADFSISQPLLRGAGRRASTYGVRIASLNKQISLSRTKLEVIRDLAAAERSYWRTYAFLKALEVRQMQYELADEQLKRAKRRVEAGKDSEIEIVRAEAGLADRLEAILIAENDVRTQQREFKRIVNVPGLGVDSMTMIAVSTPPDPVKYDFHAVELADKAIETRMEMLELELQLAQDESTIAFQKNQALPLFTVDYTYRLNGLGPNLGRAYDQLSNADFQDHVVSVNLEVPIGNVQEQSRVERAILTRLQRLSTREARRQSIRVETLNAVDAVEAGWQRILASRQSTIANARALKAEQRQYDIGQRTSTDVLDAATRLSDAQVAEIRAVTEYQVALVDLAFATGTLLGSSRVSWEPLDPRENPPKPSLEWGRHPIAEPIDPDAPLPDQNARPAFETPPDGVERRPAQQTPTPDPIKDATNAPPPSTPLPPQPQPEPVPQTQPH